MLKQRWWWWHCACEYRTAAGFVNWCADIQRFWFQQSLTNIMLFNKSSSSVLRCLKNSVCFSVLARVRWSPLIPILQSSRASCCASSRPASCHPLHTATEATAFKIKLKLFNKCTLNVFIVFYYLIRRSR